MSMKEQPPPSKPKLMTLRKGLKLAEQWVSNMHGDVEEATADVEIEGRPAGLGLGAKVSRKPQFQPSNDPIERNLMKKLGVGRKKPAADQEPQLPGKTSLESDDDDENVESRTNSFAKKRSAPQISKPLGNKKQKLR